MRSRYNFSPAKGGRGRDGMEVGDNGGGGRP